MKNFLKTFMVTAALSALFSSGAQASVSVPSADGRDYLFSLQSSDVHGGDSIWEMKKASEVSARAEDLSKSGYEDEGWMPAVVPGTVLNSLVYNGVYPEPYFGLNNKLTSGLIPDISVVGRDFYTYWFRTEFDAVPVGKDERIWMQVDGVNYRAEFWLNGKMVCFVSGMFNQQFVDVTDYVIRDGKNVLAVKVYPIDEPGGPRKGTSKSWGAAGEFRNGGNGEIGKNVSMLMTVGWDFTFLDGIRDRNTGIWRDIRFFRSGKVMLNHPFIKSELNDNYDSAAQTVSVEVRNPGFGTQKVKVTGEILGEGITFSRDVTVLRGLTETVEFSPADFPQLVIDNPRLSRQSRTGLYRILSLSVSVSGR